MIQLLKFEWLKFKRSLTIKQEVLKLVVKCLTYLYFAIIFIGLGVGLLFAVNGDQDIDHSILNEVGPYILYYFIVDLILRFVIQKFPTIDYKSYFLTPIKKGKVSQYILIRSLFHYFNIYALLFAFVFSITVAKLIQVDLSLKVFTLLVGMTILNNYLAFALSARFNAQKKTIFLLVTVLVLLVFLDIKKYIQISPFLSDLWSLIINSSWIFITPILLAIVTYFFNHNYLRQNLYLEDSTESKKLQKNNFLHFSLFDSYGKIGQLMNVELKLIFRNGKSKKLLWITILMFFYPFIFLSEVYSHYTLFVSIILTGMFALNYGQFVFAWSGSYFDLLLSRNISIKNLFLAKYYIMALSCVITLLPSILYGFLDNRYFIYLPVMCLYNIGIVLYLYMLLGCYESRRIDIQNKSSMNFEGISLLHFLIMLPIILIPYAIVYTFRSYSSEYIGIIIIAIVSILGILFHQKIIGFILQLFIKNKYKIAHTFRTEAQ